MELEEDIKFLEEYLDKEDRKFVSEYRLMFLKSIENLIKYIKEESIPSAEVEAKIEEKITYIGKLYAEDELDGEYYSEIKQLLREALQEILNKGE